MRCIVVHDKRGNVVSLATTDPDSPPVSLALGPGELVAEVDVPDDLLDTEGLEHDERVAEALRAFRVEARTDAKLVRRRDASAS
jgi:hypothetical protein